MRCLAFSAHQTRESKIARELATVVTVPLLVTCSSARIRATARIARQVAVLDRKEDDLRLADQVLERDIADLAGAAVLRIVGALRMISTCQRGIPIPISQPAPQNPLVSLPGRSSL